jgi:hypothetical protein
MKTYSIVAERIPPDKITIDCHRPERLYRYSKAEYLKRSLRFGEFRLGPAADYNDLVDDAARNDNELLRLQSTDGTAVRMSVVGGSSDIKPVREVHYRSEIHSNYFVSCFSTAPNLFPELPDTNACLVITKVEEFCNRFHAAAELHLPGWAGMDAAVSYIGRNTLGAVFSKPLRFHNQREWRFGWLPYVPVTDLQATFVTIGNIEDLGHIVRR